MITRQAMHAMIDDLDDREFELVAQAVDEIRSEGFEVSAADEQELVDGEAEFARGEKSDLRTYLEALRRGDDVDSRR